MHHIRPLYAALLLSFGLSGSAHCAQAFDVSKPEAYEAAHRSLAMAFGHELAKGNIDHVRDELARHGREMPLRELCAACETERTALGISDQFEPSVWLYQPDATSAKSKKELLVAYPPAGDDRAWSSVPAMTLDGRWTTLDARNGPDREVLVVRINGELSFERQVEQANAALRAAGMQGTGSLKASASSGHMTTRLESIRLNDDHEPWTSGAAEVYAIAAGVLPGNKAQVSIVDMPYLDYDGTTYYPRQVILDWANYSYGVADVLLYEHDDNTNYQSLVSALIDAIGKGGSLAGYSEAGAIAEIASRIVAAMPAGWFSNDDDYVDSIYTIEKSKAESRYGAAGNAFVSYMPYELPAN